MKIESYHFDTLPSTNDFAKQNSSIFSEDALSVITAKSQTKGRGRRERTWISPEGNLFATFAFFSKSLQKSSLGIVMAITCCQVIEGAKIKWPNDILMERNKVGGILTEVQSDFVVIGLGINLKTPVDLPNTACVNLQLDPLLELLSQKFLNNLAIFEKEGFTPFSPLLNQYSSHSINSQVTFKTESGPVVGTFLGFGSQGEINLRVDGENKQFVSGEF